MFARFDEIPSMTFKILRKLSIQKPLKITKGNNLIVLASSSKVFIIRICHEDRNVFAKFDETPSMIF